MKLIIKLLIAGLIINAIFQTSRVYLGEYQFQDDMQTAALFAGPRPNPAAVLKRVLEDAEIRGIPLTKDDVEVKVDRGNLTITATYTEEAQLIPIFYRHTFTLTPTVNARLLTP
jgi:hypothetical protein